jgi:hypothetical protein
MRAPTFGQQALDTTTISALRIQNKFPSPQPSPKGRGGPSPSHSAISRRSVSGTTWIRHSLSHRERVGVRGIFECGNCLAAVFCNWRSDSMVVVPRCTLSNKCRTCLRNGPWHSTVLRAPSITSRPGPLSAALLPRAGLRGRLRAVLSPGPRPDCQLDQPL